MEPQKKIEEAPEKVEKANQQEIKKGEDGNEKKIEMLNQYLEAKKQKNNRKVRYYEQLLKKHQFWDKQPTLRDDKNQIEHGNIEGHREVKEVNKNTLDLPKEELFWCEIDVKVEKQLDELYHLLTNHYVQDDDNTFRFDYSREFLKWALTPPDFQPKWLVGIRDKTIDNQLIASITGVPVHVSVEDDCLKMAEINFLCVHKKYRSINLAAKLIAEVTRRVNLKNKWQAIYTSGTVLPTPFTQAIYYHRSLNPKKLVEIGFSGLGKNQTMAMINKLYKLQTQPTIPGLRPMNKKDAPSVTKLINDGLAKYKVKFIYTEQQVRHFFLPRDDVVYSYVVEKPDTDKKKPEITDFLSFYMLPSHVMKHPKHNMLYACYSFMNFATSVPFEELIKNALILAKSLKCDVYNCLNLMDNASVFENLYFQKGDGHLNYYFYNWIMHCKHIEAKQLGVVLF